ncbi:MAG: toprim domain-containing protein [Archaeoglobi archaeon]|nr:toprim domain-containing protein [Archaeoglobi archaeon]
MLGLREFERLLRVVEELKTRSSCGAVVVVEGRRDVAALRSLGVEGEIIEASATPISAVVDAIGGREVIILTDWDSRGRVMKDRLSSLLRNANLEIWNELSTITGRYIHSVEELPGLIETLYGLHRKRM